MNCPTCDKPHYMGYEERGVYDGVIIWLCEDGHPWPRFENDGYYNRLHDAGVNIIKRWEAENDDTE